MMNENNNLNNGMNPNPGMPVEPNMGMNPNPGMPVEPSMGMNPNPGMPVEPNMGMNPNPGMPVEPNMGMNPNSGMPSPVVGQPVKQKNKKLPIIIGVVAAVVVAVVVLLIVLLGGNKSLKCKQEQSLGMGMTMTANVEFKFEGKNVKSADMLIDVDLGSYSSFKETFIQQFEVQYAEYEEKGLDVEITSDDSKIFIEFSADKDKFEAAGFSTAGTYKEVKSDMETKGFVC